MGAVDAARTLLWWSDMIFEHLLVPLDFGLASERAADLAVTIASTFGSKVDLVHAFYVPPLAYGNIMMPSRVPYEDLIREAKGALDAALARIKGRCPCAEAILVDGEPRQRIGELVAERGADLVVMGTHGRRGLSHALLGSVAERIARTSPVPVLTTGPAEIVKESSTFRHVVVATDFGEPAERAIATASALATKYDAKLTLVHVCGIPMRIYDDGAYWPTEEMVKKAERALEHALEKTREQFPAVESVLVRGDPREGILEVARERGADLVVVGTHGRRGLSRAFLGSVAERIVQTSPAPVLTVKASRASR